jgi:hypothetical protein
LIRLAAFAEIVVGTDSTLETDAADTCSFILASFSVAVDVRMDEFRTSVDSAVQLWRKMLVDWRKCVIRMDLLLSGDTIVAQIIVATFEAFVPDANDVLH